MKTAPRFDQYLARFGLNLLDVLPRQANFLEATIPGANGDKSREALKEYSGWLERWQEECAAVAS